MRWHGARLGNPAFIGPRTPSGRLNLEIATMQSAIFSMYDAANMLGIDISDMPRRRIPAYYPKHTFEMERIIEMVTRHFNIKRTRRLRISKKNILGERRSRYIAQPRHVAIWLSTKFTYCSTVQIGRYFNRDHSTVIYAARAVESWAEKRPELFTEACELLEQYLDEHGDI